MANDHLTTYLNDHLSGSVVAVELMENIEAAYAGAPIVSFIVGLRAEVEADVEELKGIMSRLQISESRTRKASAWVTEKFTELKLRIDDPAHGDLRLFESLEALSLGIEGKKSLWLALAAAAEVTPGLRIADYERLKQRAEDQRNRVETRRLEVAQAALKSEGD
ncbi:MAG TPA: hypothetical protein VGN90_03370 [Pyrinomonadaceae bacterium]|jgi:hypothetical protein|nr:hypothetical protein [Pyrinomonadaceae bacterium]